MMITPGTTVLGACSLDAPRRVGAMSEAMPQGLPVVTSPLAPAPLPISPDFPITWREPEHEKLPWFQDLMHNPTPVTPLTASIHAQAFSVGATRGLDGLFLPIKAIHQQVQNHYTYLSSEPVTGTPEEM